MSENHFFPRFAARCAMLLVCAAASVAYADRAKRWTLVNLGAAGERGSLAVTLNNAGDIGGIARLRGGPFGLITHAVIWRNGVRQDLGTDFGSPPGQGFSQVDTVNDAGTFVLNAPDGLMTYRNGTLTPLGVTGAVAKDINNRGDIVGGYSAPGAVSRAFTLRDGVMHDLGSLGGGFNQANAINDAGTIVGTASLDSQGVQWRPFVFKDGFMRDLGTFGGATGSAIDVNNQGVIVGNAQDASGRFIAFMTDGSGPLRRFVDLPGNQFAAAINQHGAIVGNADLTSFLYEDGELTILDDIPEVKANWFFLFPMAINDRGWIVGTGQRRGGAQDGEAFLLIPK
jgi:probable HAF family extracellular repeat protein